MMAAARPGGTRAAFLVDGTTRGNGLRSHGRERSGGRDRPDRPAPAPGCMLD